MISKYFSIIVLHSLVSSIVLATSEIVTFPSEKIVNTLPEAQCLNKKGILVLAHGKANHGHGDHVHEKPLSPMAFNSDDTHPKVDWEDTVLNLTDEASTKIPYPLEVAFGMWDYDNFQKAVTHLGHQKVCFLEIIPLFISDHSDVIRAQKYQFHLSETNPLPFELKRVELPSSVQMVRYQSALNDDQTLSRIIQKRAFEMSQNSQQEELILVAHGPNGDEDDLLWLRDLNMHSSRIQIHFSKIHIVTLRDDAPKPIQEKKTQELRNYVQEALTQGKTPLLLPVLIAPGGIEDGIKDRLQGLQYRFSNHMIAPDPLLIEWLVERATL